MHGFIRGAFLDQLFIGVHRCSSVVPRLLLLKAPVRYSAEVAAVLKQLKAASSSEIKD
jgi:hypothetical protein